MATLALGLRLAALLRGGAPPDGNTLGRPASKEKPVKPDITATFSIVAVDPEKHVCGSAVASKYPAVGKVVSYVRADVGAFCTQHQHVPKWGEAALDMLQQGKRPEEVISELLKSDPDAELRQLAIIDMQGRAAVHNPTQAPTRSRYWAAMAGRFYCCQGNTLTGREVVVAMATAFEDTAGSLADRLIAALIAADCAGGDHRGRLAAGIRVAKKGFAGDWLSLHVDKSDDAVLALAQKYAELTHDAKGSWPGGQLPFQDPCPDRPQPGPPWRGLSSYPFHRKRSALRWPSRVASYSRPAGLWQAAALAYFAMNDWPLYDHSDSPADGTLERIKRPEAIKEHAPAALGWVMGMEKVKDRDSVVPHLFRLDEQYLSLLNPSRA